MEQFEKFVAEPGETHGMEVVDSHEFLETEFQEHEEHHEESVFTDDPVRVYLREMGSVRLLTRQAEIDLASRMERGKLRTRKALSRSPLVWRKVLALYEEVRRGETRLEQITELGPDEEARAEHSPEVTRRLSRFVRRHKEMVELQQKIKATPERHVKIRAEIEARVPRLWIECSRALRVIPFQPAQWKEFRSLIEGPLEKIAGLERELQNHPKPATAAEYRQQIREIEALAGPKGSMRRWLKAARQGD